MPPEIVLAGRAWAVPWLAPRQNRVIVPLLMGLGKTAGRYYVDLCDIVHAAVTRARPDITRDEFDDWPLPLCDLYDAIPVIAQQTGVMDKGAPQRRKRFFDDAPPAPPNWDAIIAQFCNFLPGTTPDYWEDALTWPRLEAFRAEWNLHPPVTMLVAGFLGYEPRETISGKGIEAVLSRFAPGGFAKGRTIN